MFVANVARSFYLLRYKQQLTQELQLTSQLISLVSSKATQISQQLQPFDLPGSPREQQVSAQLQAMVRVLAKLEDNTVRINTQMKAVEAESQGTDKAIEKDVKAFNVFT